MSVPLYVAAIVLFLSGPLAFAGPATWLQSPGSGDWNTASNWTPGGPPNGPADTATFHFSILHDLSLSANTPVNSILFSNGGATAYAITTSAFALTLGGAGITNDSGLTQNFIAAGNNGVIRFANSATAGSNTSFTTHGGAESGEVFGTTEFRNSSNAGSGAFTTNGGAVSGAFGGVTQFFDTSSAAQGTFTTNGRTVRDAGSGATIFYNSSKAGNAILTTNGSTVNGGFGGVLVFFDSSTAENATLINNGGAAFFASGGLTQFLEDSSAGHAVFMIRGGAVNAGSGSALQFYNASSAANGTFTINGGVHVGEGGGVLEFHDDSSAGHGRFTTNGIVANNAMPGYTYFLDSSTAGSGTFITNPGGNNGTSGGGVTYFADHSNAGNASFTINGATQSDGSGGILEFRNNSSAGSGTFVVNGSAFRAFVCPAEICGGDYPTPAGTLIFLESATADQATLIANGGTDGGDGGGIVFGTGASGGAARVKVFGNGSLDISGLDGTFYNPENEPGTTIGSIEGDGLVFLGRHRLTIGGNEQSTAFSGVIHDGRHGETGGSLTKVGASTLTLSGANTYTGPTSINGGTLRVDGSITSAVTVNNGGMLGGSGATGNVTVNGGGIVAPGSPVGALAIRGDYVQNAGGVLKIDIAGTGPGDSDHLNITGGATIGGTLEVRFVNGYLPISGQIFKIVNVGGGLVGDFAQITFPNLKAGFQFKAEFVNGSYQITALSDGVAAHGFVNLSTRTRVDTGDNTLIGGFIVTGNTSKKVIIRAIGPSLALGGTPLPNRLADPTLELRDNAGALIFFNDNWVDSPQKQQIIDSTIPPSDDREAAIVATLPPGNYTAIMRGLNNTSGIGVLEVYDLAHVFSSSLANISSRGLVEAGDNVMIGGFIVDSQTSQLIVRALGPSLTQAGIVNALADPTLELYNGDGNIIAFNNDWQDTDQEKIKATGIAPTHEKESVILATLAPGNYTAIVRGQNKTVGVGLVEVYNVQ